MSRGVYNNSAGFQKPAVPNAHTLGIKEILCLALKRSKL